MTLRAFALVSASLLLQPIAAVGEVRVCTSPAGGPALEIRPLAGSTWLSRQPTDPSVLNPHGDIWGDSAPAYAPHGQELLAAWTRASDQTLRIVRASSNHSIQTSAYTSTFGVVGQPEVTTAASGWVLGLQVAEPSPHVELRLVSADAVGDPLTVADGALIDILAVGDTAHVLTHHPGEARLDIATVALHFQPWPVPVPFSSRSIELRLQNASQVTRARLQSFAAWSPCIEQTDDGYLLAWKTGDGFVGSVTLTAEGVGEPVFVRGPNGSCQATLNAAARE